MSAATEDSLKVAVERLANTGTPDREKLLTLAEAACEAWEVVDDSNHLVTQTISTEGIQQHAKLENAMRELRAALGMGGEG